MAENHWYPFYIGDYQKKTAHLSLSEHGAYRLLLDHYYGTGSPLPTEKDILFRICRAQNLQEKRTILSIISQYFHEKNGKYFHKKAEEILIKRLKYSESQSANASAKFMPTRASTTTITKEEESKPPSPLNKKFQIPPWMSNGTIEAWEGWLEIRKGKKAPNSANALGLALNQLEKLKAQGHEPKAVLEQSTMRGWTGLFPIKQDFQQNQFSLRPASIKPTARTI